MNSPLNYPIISPRLVGRVREMEWLDSVLDIVQQGRGKCVLIAGEAGIGKSRLLAEAARKATQRAFIILQGHCFEQDAAFPYAPWVDLLRAFFAHLWADQINELLGALAFEFVKLLPELALALPDLQPSPPLDPEAEKRRLFETLAQFFTRQTVGSHGPAPLLVIVEDLHWSDEASLDFLHFFARRLSDFPILVLASYRREDVSTRLAHLLAQLDRERRMEEILLHPLSRDEIATMVSAIFDIQRPIKADFLDRIMPLTEGNPFFIEEVLKALVEAGDIFYVDGRWERKPGPELHIPRSVQDAVQQRVQEVSAAARNLLTRAAVIGQRFDFALLRELTALDEPELLNRIHELIDKQLVVEQSAEAFAFRHALTREAVYATVLKRERQALHQTIAETLERLYGKQPDPPLADLAYQFYQAGSWEKAMDYARRAGERAQAVYAWREAVDHFTRAIDAAQHLSITPAYELLRARAKAHETLGDFELARIDLEAALVAARTREDRRAEWQVTLDLGFLWTAQDQAQSGAYLRRALETARPLEDPLILGQTLNRIGNWYMNHDEPFEAQRYHEEALAIFQSLSNSLGVAETLELLSITCYGAGDSIQGAAYARQAIPLFEQANNRQGWMQSLAHLVTPAQFDTEVAEPTDVAQLADYGYTALKLAQEMGWRSGEAIVLINLAYCLAPAGDYARALDVLSTAAAIGDELNHQILLALAHWGLGQVYLSLLAYPQAQQHLEQARMTAEASNAVFVMRVSTADLALAYLFQNDLTRADAVLDASLDDQPPRTRHLRTCWNARAELALVQGNPARALQIVDMLLASATNFDTYGIRGIPRLAKVRGEALAALGYLEEAEAVFLEALAGADEQGRRALAWRIHISLGKLYRASKRPTQAELAFAAARKLIDELAASLSNEALREHFLQRALGLIPSSSPMSSRQAAKRAFGGLTTREREVAVLIAQGKTNAEIADVLVTSKRTIDKHVGSILTKLDFTSRAQIAVWAIEKGLTSQRG